MIKLGGYIFTIIHLAGIYFPSTFPGTAGQLSRISGHLAFSLFALLIARGARRTSNHFMYFVRLLLAALAAEAILYATSLRFNLYFTGLNPLFTYAASIALIAGLSMVIGCYRDLVAHAVPAGGQLDKKILFGLPVNPGNYRIAPATGIILGLATAGLALFLVLYFNFAYGLFGVFYILLAFIAMRDPAGSRRFMVKGSLFRGAGECGRTILYITALAAAALLLSYFFKGLRAWVPPAYLVTLLAVPAAALIPESPSLPPRFGKLLYAVLPAICGIFYLIRLLV